MAELVWEDKERLVMLVARRMAAVREVESIMFDWCTGVWFSIFCERSKLALF